jgi:RNA polymerase sigma factor (sigma-70 family)
MELTQDIIDVVEKFELNEDAKQDAYVKLLESELPDFETKTHRDNYIKQLVFWTRKNEESKLANRQRLIEENEREIRDIYSQHEKYAESPDNLIQHAQALDEFLEDMSDTNRRTFERLYLDGLTPDELADEEGVARNAIDQRVHNIKKLVKEKF